jgi:hypothetical protein
MDAINENAQTVDNPKYPNPTIVQLKKIFSSTSKSSSSYNVDIKLTDSDRAYLNKPQINVTQKFLEKYADTDSRVFENLLDDILLLNIPSDQQSFDEFLKIYDSINRSKADNNTQRFQTYCEYYLNRLRSLKHIQVYLEYFISLIIVL